MFMYIHMSASWCLWIVRSHFFLICIYIWHIFFSLIHFDLPFVLKYMNGLYLCMYCTCIIYIGTIFHKPTIFIFILRLHTTIYQFRIRAEWRNRHDAMRRKENCETNPTTVRWTTFTELSLSVGSFQSARELT